MSFGKRNRIIGWPDRKNQTQRRITSTHSLTSGKSLALRAQRSNLSLQFAVRRAGRARRVRNSRGGRGPPYVCKPSTGTPHQSLKCYLILALKLDSKRPRCYKSPIICPFLHRVLMDNPPKRLAHAHLSRTDTFSRKVLGR